MLTGASLRGGCIKKVFLFIFVLAVLIVGCKNPFSPSFDDGTGGGGTLISDRKTVDGIFTNLQYAYTFKDTTIYGDMLTGDFIFSYRNYELGFDDSWGRDEEMKVTNGLFQNSQRLDLIWNNKIMSTEDSLTANIVRSFNLTITFNPTDIVRVDGRVNLSLRKDAATSKWYITKWIDESNY